jgi:hypothetical protein
VAVLVDCFVDASNAADKAEADTQLAEYRESRQARIFPLLPLIAHAPYELILSYFLSARDSKDKSKFRQKSRSRWLYWQVRSTLDPLLDQLASCCVDDLDLSKRLQALFKVGAVG